GLAEQFRATSQELETQRKDLRDLQAFKDLVFQSVGTGLIALDRYHRITAFTRAAEEIVGRSAPETIGRPWTALFGDSVPLPEIEARIERNPRASTRHETLLRRPDGTAVPVLLEHRAPAAGLKILRVFSGPLVWRVDPQRFRQVLWNLCLNAVEAMPEGGELRVGATLVPGHKLEVSVADSGHGIAPDDLAHV